LQSKDALSFSRLEQGVIRHLDLAYRPDFSSQTMAGTARYQVGSPAAGDLYLDIAGLEIHSIHSGDRSLTWMVDAHDPVLGQRLTIQGLNGARNFEIEFTTPRGATALQWLEARQTHDGQAPFLFSQCQAIHARSIFPCQDTPAVRFTYTAELHAPEGLTALMAAAPKAETGEPSIVMKCANPYRLTCSPSPLGGLRRGRSAGAHGCTPSRG